jgi:hypothetical protein
MVNTYRWDYGTLAALVAPRALLLSNTDDDRIFPLDGVERIHWQLRKLYGLLGVPKKLGLQISYGPHLDTQELQVAAFRWFNVHLKGEDPKIEVAALKLFEPEQLKVFDHLPEDQRNTTVHEWFVPMAAKPQAVRDTKEWATLRDAWMTSLREKVFRGWPTDEAPLDVDERRLRQFNRKSSAWNDVFLSYKSDPATPLTLFSNGLLEGTEPGRTIVRVGTADEADYAYASVDADASRSEAVVILAAPRGVGESAWDASPKKQTQHRRRFYLLGQTLEGQQIYDVRRAIQALHTVPELKDAKVTLVADGPTAGAALYAALFEPSVERLELTNLPASHMPSADDPHTFGPPLLNVLRYLDLPQVVAMVAERATVVLHTDDPEAWRYPVEVAAALGWEDRIVVKSMEK